MKRLLMLLGGVALAGALAGTAAAQQVLTVASFGGSYQEAQRKAFFEPTAKALGIQIREETLKGLADVRVQVRANAVTWDVADLGATDCAVGSREGLFEPLDYSVIKTDGIDKRMVAKDWIGIIYYSTVLSWNKKKYGANPPKDWADFWDAKKFPGARSLRNQPQVMLEIALLADGVSRDNLYPLDLDRAFKKMESIKPHITTWWTSGGQSAQLMKDGEVDMIAIWNGRISTAIKDGADAAITYQDGLLNADCLVVPKGAKNKELAMKAIALFLSPEQQAQLPKLIDYGPVNAKAFDLNILSEDEISRVNSAPEKAKVQAVVDVNWWGDNGAQVRERWDAFLQK